jgi:hypothetical protein
VKRLLRILRAFATLLPLILCITTAIFWIRSNWRLDELDIFTRESHWSIWSIEGRILIHRQHWFGLTPRWRSSIDFHTTNTSKHDDFGVAHIPFTHNSNGFAYGALTNRLGNTGIVGHVYMLPHWFLVLLLAIYPARIPLRWIFHHALTRDRSTKGLCPQCGYDLRSTPTRCPECGFQSSVPAMHA